jgi:Photosynthesis system II assembly factor YCF48
MPSDDRDRQLDQALARHLRRSSSDACPDAEILAAYHEGTLAPDELLAFNQHFADCKMCQETLAILAESDDVGTGKEEWKQQKGSDFGHAFPSAPPAAMIAASAPVLETREITASAMAPAPRQQKSRPRALRYLIPIGALAAVALSWVGLREHNASTQVAEVREQQDGFSKIQPVPEPKAVSPSAESLPAAPAPADKKNKSPVSADQLSEARRKEQSELAKRLQQEELTSSLEQRQDDARNWQFSTRAGSASAGATASSRVGAGSGVAASQPKSASGNVHSPAPGLAAPKAAAGMAQPGQAASNAQSYLRDAASTNPNVFLSPDSTQVWILGSSGAIKHGTSDGDNWTNQTSGVTSDLIAGSAASSSIVWIVGKSGTILLTTDGGANWKKIASPVSADLAGVQATDARSARIWDSANHQYATTDGGVTWKPVTN